MSYRMSRQDDIEEKLIRCSSCCELTSVEASYSGNLCASCRKSNPYEMLGLPEKNTRTYPLSDRALSFRRIALSTVQK